MSHILSNDSSRHRTRVTPHSHVNERDSGRWHSDVTQLMVDKYHSFSFPNTSQIPLSPCPANLMSFLSLNAQSQMKQPYRHNNKQTWFPIRVGQPLLSLGLAFECSDIPSAAP